MSDESDIAPHVSNSPVDPTKNVLDLVQAQAKFQEKVDGMALSARMAEDAWIVKYFEALNVAERRRLDDLAEQKKDYDKQISETQTGQMKTTSDLVSTQLDKVTSSLSDTINKMSDNFASMLQTVDKRLSAVEQFRYETGGRSSVSDPAMQQIAADIKELKLSTAGGAGEKRGVDANAQWMITIVLAAVAVGSFLFAVLKHS
jgi:hypothetical protein